MWFWFVLAGLVSGVLGGMGMGGGTLLIPILTLFLGLEQHMAQGINLLVFIPMGIIAIIIHICNKLIDYRIFLWLVIPAVITSLVASSLSSKLNSGVLHTIFGIFLIAVAVYELIVAIYRTVHRKKPVLKNKIYKN